MFRILVVEDSPESQTLIRRALCDDYALSFASTAEAGRREAVAQVPDLVLLDAGLPDSDGFALCSQLRCDPALQDVPIVFLTARGETSDKVMAFRIGADDYLEKPFEAAELRARIEARLRRTQKKDPQLSFPDMQLDPVRQEVILRDDDREWSADLTPREFRILHCLAATRGMPVPRRQLMESAWAGIAVSERTVDTHVSNLRKKLAPHGDRLEAVRGVGYRLTDPPEPRLA